LTLKKKRKEKKRKGQIRFLTPSWFFLFYSKVFLRILNVRLIPLLSTLAEVALFTFLCMPLTPEDSEKSD
jgi:hypothetical protein